jgi:dolichol-phosphate mannosyltransferase
MKVSLIIPTYNEKDNLAPLLAEIAKLGLKDYEIVFVDDSSPDGTGQLILEAAKSNPAIRLITREGKQGLGSAYYRGMCEAKGDYIVTMEADFLTGLNVIQVIVSDLSSGVPLVLTSRYIKGGSSDIYWLKRIGSRALNIIAGWYLGVPAHDLSFALRGVRRDVFIKIQKQITLFGHPDFFTQVSFLAYTSGGSLKEVPVAFTSRIYGQSKVTKLFGAGFNYLAKLPVIKRSATIS